MTEMKSIVDDVVLWVEHFVLWWVYLSGRKTSSAELDRWDTFWDAEPDLGKTIQQKSIPISKARVSLVDPILLVSYWTIQLNKEEQSKWSMTDILPHAAASAAASLTDQRLNGPLHYWCLKTYR